MIPTTRPQATATENLVNRLRNDVLSKEHATSYVTGTTAGTVDFTERITGRMAWLIFAVVVISFILLTIAFRSVVIATKAAILNLLFFHRRRIRTSQADDRNGGRDGDRGRGAAPAAE